MHFFYIVMFQKDRQIDCQIKKNLIESLNDEYLFLKEKTRKKKAVYYET